MRTELAADVTVHRFWVLAELAWWERRPELGAVCRIARDTRARITTQVVQHALPGLADVGAANVIQRCQELGLCDASGSLTDWGETAAESDEAPIPEQGVYDIWAADHALLDRRILHVERITHSRDRFDFTDIQPLPVEPEIDTGFASVVDPQRFFALRALLSNEAEPGARLRPTNARCEVKWVLDWASEVNGFHLEGAIDKSSGRSNFTTETEEVKLDLWRLVENWALGPLRPHGSWSATEQRLEVGFAGRSLQEQDDFTMDLEIDEVQVPGFGRWSDIRLSDVPIKPATAADATQWALARLNRRLRGNEARYTRARVRRLFAQVTEDTPLASFAPTLPHHDAMLATYADDPEMFWRLAAPVDLAPFSIPEEELGSMTVGADASEEPEAGQVEAGAVWVPYQGRRSMGTVVGQLTEREETRRVLLVDHFVRGRRNLGNLELLVATLAQQGSPRLDVWTGDDVGKDATAEIERVTGHPPRHFNEVFGHAEHPHDRYVVIVPQQGEPFGWQMSNSPLDARADDDVNPSPATPLRWRGLAGTRLTVDRLPGRIAAWAGQEGS